MTWIQFLVFSTLDSWKGKRTQHYSRMLWLQYLKIQRSCSQGGLHDWLALFLSRVGQFTLSHDISIHVGMIAVRNTGPLLMQNWQPSIVTTYFPVQCPPGTKKKTLLCVELTHTVLGPNSRFHGPASNNPKKLSSWHTWWASSHATHPPSPSHKAHLPKFPPKVKTNSQINQTSWLFNKPPSLI